MSLVNSKGLIAQVDLLNTCSPFSGAGGVYRQAAVFGFLLLFLLLAGYPPG